MKVKHVLDIFGPRINCHAKFRYSELNRYEFETDGMSFSDDESLLESYVTDINIKEEDGIPFIEFVMTSR